MSRAAAALAVAVAVAGCAREELLHDLDELQANEVLVALDERGVHGTKVRGDGADPGWTVAVPGADASRAHRILADRALPRARPPGFGDVFAKGSMVPTQTEEHALYLHALGGELARSVEAIDGVVEARVHLGLPRPDPLRPGERIGPRAAVLVKCKVTSCSAIRALEGGIRSLVAGAADGLDAAAVSVVVAEAADTPPSPAPARRPRSALLVGLAALAATAAGALGVAGLRSRVRREAAA
jgi:type III secretion protein J